MKWMNTLNFSNLSLLYWKWDNQNIKRMITFRNFIKINILCIIQKYLNGNIFFIVIIIFFSLLPLCTVTSQYQIFYKIVLLNIIFISHSLRFLTPIKLTTTIQLKYCWKCMALSTLTLTLDTREVYQYNELVCLW